VGNPHPATITGEHPDIIIIQPATPPRQRQSTPDNSDVTTGIRRVQKLNSDELTRNVYFLTLVSSITNVKKVTGQTSGAGRVLRYNSDKCSTAVHFLTDYYLISSI
jgi:hypothetical protein